MKFYTRNKDFCKNETNFTYFEKKNAKNCGNCYVCKKKSDQ